MSIQYDYQDYDSIESLENEHDRMSSRVLVESPASQIELSDRLTAITNEINRRKEGVSFGR